MLAFIIRRLLGMVIVLVVVSFIVYGIFVVIPGGDPAERIAGRTATPANIADIRQKLGLDKSLPVQWWDMISQLATGKLVSYTDQLSVSSQIWAGLPVTISLSVGAALIWLTFGVLVGVISAVTAGRLSDRAITIFALIGVSMPVFWLGIILRYFFAEQRSWFPDGGYVPLQSNPAQWFYHLLLPWFTLAVLFIGFYGRVLRSNILDTINEDYVRTAKSKGLNPTTVMRKHVLRNSLIPIVTLFGLDFAAVLGGGAILTETVYDLHGVGFYAETAIQNLDLPPLMGVTLFGAFFIVLFSTIVDVFYAFLDPRIRIQ
jgi:peptide/nickel transport system permease protein